MAGLKKARRKQAKAKALRGYKNRALTPGVTKAAGPEVSPFVQTTRAWWDKDKTK